MKLDMTKEWFARRIALEDDLEVGAGLPQQGFEARDEPNSTEQQSQEDFLKHLAFGSLVKLLRRSRRLSVDQLADAARVDPAEILGIECNPEYLPRPRTVHQLATYFGIPERSLARLSNLRAGHNNKLRDAAIRFAAHSSKVMELTREERSALAEFVDSLSSQDAEM